MDTSRDYNSPTLDFLLGNGANLPVPADRDLAKLLFVTINNLMEQGILADVIGNRPPEASENYKLAWALDMVPDDSKSHLKTLRAREILTTNCIDDADHSATIGHDYLYVACTRSEALWLVVSARSGTHRLSQLTVESMVDFFSYRTHWATHIGLRILDNLTKVMQDRTVSWQEKASRIERSATSLYHMSERINSAFIIPRTSGDGFEG
jgi:hypothetical protein